jgi:hypothetical protein
MVEANTITRRFHLLAGMLDERTRRLVAAAEALSIGRGGSVAVASATGMSRRAIQQGIKELLEDVGPGTGRVRREGGGRKKTVIKDLSLLIDLERFMVPASQGNMESPLRWTYKSVRQLTEELKQMGHKTSHRMVAELLHELGYNLKVNRKIREDYADWDAQVEYINRMAQAHFAVCDPVISVEVRKKEFVGAFRNRGREWNPQDNMEKMWAQDFRVSELGQVTPNDVCNLGQDHSSIDIHVDHNMETFTGVSIQHWWHTTARMAYPQSRRLLITPDWNGNHEFRTQLWKQEIQKLADETGLAVTVCYLPPGTSKWNKIKYQFRAYIIQNWRGQPSISFEVVIKLIEPTITPTGFNAQNALATNIYPSGYSGSDAEMASIPLAWEASHCEWNYTILPQSVSQ